MGWGAVAQGIANFFITWRQSTIERATKRAQQTITEANVDAENTIAAANADTRNLLRQAGNEFQAAQVAFAQTTRSIKNQEAQRATGEKMDVFQTNVLRAADQMVRGRLGAQLTAANTMGALRADAAARGVGGSAASMMRSVAALQLGSAETQFADKQGQLTWDQALQRSGLVRTAYLSQDLGQELPSMDYGIDIAPVKLAPLFFQSGSAIRDATAAVFGNTNFSAGTGSTVGGSGGSGYSSAGWGNFGAQQSTNYSLNYGFNGSNYNSFGSGNNLSDYTGTTGFRGQGMFSDYRGGGYGSGFGDSGSNVGASTSLYGGSTNYSSGAQGTGMFSAA